LAALVFTVAAATVVVYLFSFCVRRPAAPHPAIQY